MKEILWWAKPTRSVLFKEEIQIIKRILFSAMLFLLGFALMTIKVYDSAPYDMYIFVIFMAILFISPILFPLVKWFNRKKNTYFIITNRRVLEIFKVAFYQDFDLLYKHLNEIESFEIRKRKKGANLYLGKYRFHFDTPFDYNLRTTIKSHDYIPNTIYNSFNKLMNNVNYLCFFDLEDVEIPAGLIRKYATNAIEYIDHDYEMK